MKLRNKKTGEIVDGHVIVAIKSETDPSIIMHDNTVGSVAKLNEKWEDYEPVEPIFDGKIRKGIRAWWDMQDNPFEKAAVMLKSMMADRDGFYHWKIFGYIRNGEEKVSTDMEFRTKKLYAYKPHHDYTREELCGEEEE